MPRRSWLCIAYAFPPINRSGTHRTLGFLRRLDRLGWNAAVLTVEPRGESLDPSLLDRVPTSTTVIRVPWTDWVFQAKRFIPHAFLHRSDAPDNGPDSMDHYTERGEGNAAHRAACGGSHPGQCGTGFQPVKTRVENPCHISCHGPIGSAWREWLSRWLVMPDSRCGWIMPALRASGRAIRENRPDVLYSTSPYASAHLIGLVLSRRFGIPWVADFRDPWGANPFHAPRPSLHTHVDAWLESRVLRQADRIVVNTPAMRDQLVRRRPFVADKCTTILNGFDAESFANLTPRRIAPPDHVVFMHSGQFYGPRSPIPWFAAFQRVLSRVPSLRGSVHFALLGSESFNGRRLMDLATAAGLQGCVHVLGPKTHDEAFSYMAGSDALILAGSDGPGGELQIPGKLYEYLALGKPMIATFSPRHPGVDILRQAHAQVLICDPNDGDALARAIEQIALRRTIEVQDPWSGVYRFDREHRGDELAALFHRIARPVEDRRLVGRHTGQVHHARLDRRDRFVAADQRLSSDQGVLTATESRDSALAHAGMTTDPSDR